MKLLLIRQIWKHHSLKSGYDRVFQTFESKDVDFIFMKQHVKGYGLLLKLLQMLFPKQKEYLSASLFLTEIRILIRCFFFKPDVIHFTYLQHEFLLLKYKFFRRKTKLVATIHLPKKYWETQKQSWSNFKYLDQIVVLDQVSLLFFKENELTKNKVFFIPHPVDKIYYQSNSFLKFNDEKIHCLYIGRFLRNMNLFFDIVEYCNKHNEDIIFHFSFPANKNWIKDTTKLNKIIQLDNVVYKDYLSEQELLELYQKCDALVQPLLDSTANNVIIESVACGLPVVINDLPALHTYLDDDVAIFCDNTVEGFVAGILKSKDKSISENNKLASLEEGKQALYKIYNLSA